MANLKGKNFDEDAVYIKANNAGTIGDPLVIVHSIEGITPVGAKLPVAGSDQGPNWVATRTYTTSADLSTAAAITVAPESGKKIVADDVLISTDTQMLFSIQMETSANVLAAVRIPANGIAQITLRDGLKGDAADKKLFGKASVPGNVYITVCYHSES